MTDAEKLWTVCADALRQQVSEATWMTWFDAVRPKTVDGDTLVLTVPSSLAKEKIEGRYLEAVRNLMSDAVGVDVPIRLEVRTTPAPNDGGTTLLSGSDWSRPMGGGEEGSRSPGNPDAYTSVGNIGPYSEDVPLNLQYTFDRFVIGASNRFAHAAALSVAETPAKSYNPLFIHGGAGLGKTHLLHAIGNYVRENFPSRHIRYVSTETFMNEFVDAIRTNTTTAFKRRYRQCDVLLVDDVQFMENKEGLQEEFFHTFNSLHEATKQIVITSDRPPRSLATLEDRLRSRFLMGLITDVQPPELETRLAILKKKAGAERTEIPDEVLEFIAVNVKDNIRELEGALIRVSAFASLNRQPLTQEMAEMVLSDLVGAGLPRQITPKLILDATSDAFGFSVEELCGTSRRRPLVTARQVGMYLFRELTDYSYPAIAREFGGRDHTTVIHAVEKITNLMGERRQIFNQ
ncbi:MAG TPA: chromosomal replication initiator protein DnaA, partial [Acidimicrobiales bacterium]|nr:chromosomal replication initiator protein DnaA [Acidimicrobiales bacterium]